MTYSRPSTSTVNALFLPSRPQGAQGVERVQPDVGQSGRFMDFSNPAQAGANAGRGLQEVGSFLSNALEIAQPIYADYMKSQGVRQAGEFMKNMDIASLYRDASPEKIAALQSLNPFARVAVADAAAKAAAFQYSERLIGLSRVEPLLVDPSSDPKMRADAASRVFRAAREESGIDKIPGAAMAPHLETVQRAGAFVRADALTRRALEAEKEDSGIRAAGYLVELKKIASQPSEVAYDTLYNLLENVNSKAGSAYTQEQAGQELLKATQGVYAGYLADGDIEGASEFLKRMGAYADANTFELLPSGEKAFVGGTMVQELQNGEKQESPYLNTFNVDIGEGRTLRGEIAALRASLRDQSKAASREQLLGNYSRSVRELNLAAQSGDPSRVAGARAAVEAQEALIAQQDPSLLPQLAPIATNVSGTQDALPNPQRDRALEQLTLLRTRPGVTTEQFQRAVMSNPHLRSEDRRGLIEAGVKADPTLLLVNSGLEANGPATGGLASRLTKAQLATGRLGTYPPEELLRANAAEIETTLRTNTAARVKALVASGKTVTPQMAAEIAKNELDNIEKSRMKEVAKSVERLETPDDRDMGRVNAVFQRVRNLGGAGTVGIFTRDIVQESVRAGYGSDYKNVQRYFLNMMGKIKDRSGNPMFPDPAKAFREYENDVKRQRNRGSAPQAAAPPGLGDVVPVPGLPAVAPAALRWLGAAFEAGSGLGRGAGGAGSSGGGEGGGRQSARPQAGPLQVATQVVTTGLGQLAGVVLGGAPAAAATGPTGGRTRGGATGAGRSAPLLNPEGVEELARVMRGAQPLTGTTRPLPQVPAAAPAQVVSLAISNVNHPYFVAIGIAEGNRTPDGGFTRSYYGHSDPNPANGWNIGTVSGKGPNPQAVDRVWMAKLSALTPRVHQFLQQVGVPRGTAGYNRFMFNALDLAVQAPAAVSDFLRQLPGIVKQGLSIEAIAKARADSFVNPATGRLDAGGFGNSYSRLLADQRSRAGAFDYKRRL